MPQCAEAIDVVLFILLQDKNRWESHNKWLNEELEKRKDELLQTQRERSQLARELESAREKLEEEVKQLKMRLESAVASATSTLPRAKGMRALEPNCDGRAADASG